MTETGKRKGSAMNIEIAQRLYELRRKHGFSQESLAAELGLSRQAISKWERSESAPDMGNLIALADLYGMTIDELIRPTDIELEDGERATDADDADIIDSDAIEENIDIDAIEEEITADETLTMPAASTLEETNTEEAATCCPPPTSAPFDIETAHPSASIKSTIPDVSAADAAPDAYGPYDPPTMPDPPASSDAYAPPAADDIKQVIAHGHIYSRPQAPAKPRCKLRSFPYPLLVTVTVIVLGLVFSFWESIWLFLTIPFYYWIARIIERDPNFLKEHGFAGGVFDPADYVFSSDDCIPSVNAAQSTVGTAQPAANTAQSTASAPYTADAKEAE